MIKWNIFFSFFFLVLLSCHPSKKLSEKKPNEKTWNINDWIHFAEKKYPYHLLSLKGEAHIDGSEWEGSGDIHIQCIPDSLVLLVIRKFGFEIARLLIQNDSVTVINRIDHEWDKKSTSEWATQYAINDGFETLQSILLRGFFLPKNNVWEISEDQTGFIKLSNKDSKLQIINIFKSENQIPSRCDIIRQDSALNVTIHETSSLNSEYIPSNFHWNWKASGQLIQMHIRWTQITDTETQKIKFNIPAHYTREKIL